MDVLYFVIVSVFFIFAITFYLLLSNSYGKFFKSSQNIKNDHKTSKVTEKADPYFSPGFKLLTDNLEKDMKWDPTEPTPKLVGLGKFLDKDTYPTFGDYLLNHSTYSSEYHLPNSNCVVDSLSKRKKSKKTIKNKKVTKPKLKSKKRK
jgi:hypothetical protein